MIESLLGLSLLHLAALVSPGPDYLLISRYALLKGKQLAILASLGIAMGVLAHAVICLTGFSVVFTQWPNSLWIIRILGATYLIYLGVMSLNKILIVRKDGESQQLKEKIPLSMENPSKGVSDGSVWQAFYAGLITNLLNPKAVIFFASLFTAFIPAERLFGFGLSASVLLFSLTFLWFTLVASVLSHPRVQSRAQQHHHKLEVFTGVAFMLMGLMIIGLPLLST